MSTATKKGRPTVSNQRPKVSITLPPTLLEKVDEEAAANYASRSAVIVVALRAHFAESSDK